MKNTVDVPNCRIAFVFCLLMHFCTLIVIGVHVQVASDFIVRPVFSVHYIHFVPVLSFSMFVFVSFCLLSVFECSPVAYCHWVFDVSL